MKIIQSAAQGMIPFSDRPLPLGGKTEYISMDEFVRKIGHPFLEKIDASHCHISSSNIREDITRNLSSTELKTQFESILQQPRQDLAICKINDQVGYGVFAVKDLPKDTVLCFYSGTLIQGSTVKSNNDHGIEYHGLDITFSTMQYRGIASFFQHLSTVPKVSDPKRFIQMLQSIGQTVSESDLRLNDELYSIEFVNNTVQSNLATENTRREYIRYKDIPVVLLVTDRNIKAGEQLGFNYGKDYWLGRGISPELFDKHGNIMSTKFYKRTYYQLKLATSTYTGELLPLVDQLKKGKKQIAFIDDKQQHQNMDAIIVLNALHRIHGMTEDEYQTLTNYYSLFGNYDGIFHLANKYKLMDSSQMSFEKGLRNAAANNEINDVKTFIPLVKNINASDTNPSIGRTAIHWAAFKKYQDCYQILLESGADCNIPDAKGVEAYKYLKN